LVNQFKKVAVLGCNSDIGTFLCKQWLNLGCEVVGTYRNDNENLSLLKKRGLKAVKIDFSNVVTTKNLKKFIDISDGWDVFLSSIGDTEPLDNFIDSNIDLWSRSVKLNFENQVRVIHYLLNAHKPSKIRSRSILFLAGGAMNSATKYMSAYTISKIALTKFVELAQFENIHDKYTIIGPGWVKTKIHHKTLNAKGNAEELSRLTQKKIKENNFNSLEDLQKMLEWVIASPISLVGGRNFSLTTDAWWESKFLYKLRTDKEIFKLRRYQGKVVKNES
jgi:NAD(P)-dependent dehydrogenase (short-subunit alcohol dehydrogenase family)